VEGGEGGGESQPLRYGGITGWGLRAAGECVPSANRPRRTARVTAIRKFRITAADGKNYDTGHYNLSAIVQDRLFVSDFDAEVMQIARNDEKSGNDEGCAG
jgi:hypothetical protein